MEEEYYYVSICVIIIRALLSLLGVFLLIYIDLKGRVNNMSLAKSKALLPMFEAIVNSFQSIEDLNDATDAFIKITLERNTNQQVINEYDDGSSYPIENIVIEDNGVGFNSDNFKSFQTSDSTFKSHKGGKGVGRLLWLKAFEEIIIESRYKEIDGFYDRSFHFSLDGDYVNFLKEGKSEECNRFTRIKLVNFKKPYCDACPKKLETIAYRIIEHCISFFLLKECPNVILEDGFSSIYLNDLFKDMVKVNAKKDCFMIYGYNFEVIHVRLHSAENNKHMMHYCANNREVYNVNLNRYIPNLSKKIVDEEEQMFTYSAYLTGEYLDENVNLERTNFNILDKWDESLINEITMDKINTNAIKSVKSYLKEYLEPIDVVKKERIAKYINTNSPQYKPILKHKESMIDDIKPDLSDNELELELFKIRQKFDYEVKKEGEKILRQKIDDIKDIEQYKKEYQRYVECANDLGKSSLAQYIIHRKVILNLFENGLCYNNELKYSKEEYIHNLIFPMRSTSDDIGYDKHNLWIIDEKLAYHYYLASDIKLKNMEAISVDSDSRPDILILDNPIAVVNDEKPYNSVVIFEFKRPGRESYNEQENPIIQVYKYVREIRNGKAVDKNGRSFIVSENTPFYLYIICDMTEKIKDFAKYFNLTKTPDSLGYFGYNRDEEINAYIEIISYDKLIDDANKRNKILFDKLFNPRI